MVPAPAERKSVERTGRTRPRRVEHRPRPLRVPGGESAAPRAGYSRPGHDQKPAGHRPGTRTRRHPDLPVANRRAIHPGHRGPAQRRPRRLPRPGCTGVDQADRGRDPGQPEIHRVHGLRPDPHDRQRPQDPARPARAVDLVTRTRPPPASGPGHLGHRPENRRAARQRPRPRDAHHPARPPVHPAIPDPVPDLPPPHARHRQAHPHRHHPHLLHLPPRTRQPPPPQLARIAPAHRALISDLEAPAAPADPAAAAYRARIRARYAELYAERTRTETDLAALQATAAPDNDPTLLDDLPTVAGILPDAPDRIKLALLAAFDINALSNKDADQVTVWATITSDTPRPVAALLNDPRTDDDPGQPATAPISQLGQNTPATSMVHSRGQAGACGGWKRGERYLPQH